VVSSTLRRSRGRLAIHGTSNGVATPLVYLSAAAVAALLVYLSTLGMIFAIIAVGLAGLIALLAIIGSTRMGYLFLMAAFATAPMYKALAPSPGAPVTATDLLFVAAFGLLVPNLLRGTVRLPTLYFVGVGLVLVTGLIASAFSVDPKTSLISLMFWMIVMLGLPVAFALLAPSGTLVSLMAASFVAGQIFSLAYGTAKGDDFQGRHAGYSTHPNYYAQAGMLALALLLYLGYRHRGRLLVLILPAVGLCAATVVLSGSRAATVVVAVLVLMVPVVERSALTGFLLAILGALGLLLLPVVAGIGGEGSSLARLAGGTSSSYSNSERTNGLKAGLDRFFEHPFLGNGLIDLFDVHNNFLEVGVAVGIFGLAGYLMVLYAFARPIVSLGQYRRLSYGVWAYIGFGATVPSLYDRSVWAVVALSVVAVVEHEHRRLERAASGPPSADVRPLASLSPDRL
jgi:O-antigen ligase